MKTQSIQQVAAAFVSGTKLSRAKVKTDSMTVWLLGSPIARRMNARLEISMAGYPTQFTCTAINAILRAAGSAFQVHLHVDRSNRQMKSKRPVAVANGVISDFPVNGWRAVTDANLEPLSL